MIPPTDTRHASPGSTGRTEEHGKHGKGYRARGAVPSAEFHIKARCPLYSQKYENPYLTAGVYKDAVTAWVFKQPLELRLVKYNSWQYGFLHPCCLT